MKTGGDTTAPYCGRVKTGSARRRPPDRYARAVADTLFPYRGLRIATICAIPLVPPFGLMVSQSWESAWFIADASTSQTSISESCEASATTTPVVAAVAQASRTSQFADPMAAPP